MMMVMDDKDDERETMTLVPVVCVTMNSEQRTCNWWRTPPTEHRPHDSARSS